MGSPRYLINWNAAGALVQDAWIVNPEFAEDRNIKVRRILRFYHRDERDEQQAEEHPPHGPSECSHRMSAGS
jgi:hypothetical protein